MAVGTCKGARHLSSGRYCHHIHTSKVQKTDNSKCWWWHVTTGTLVNHWRGWNMDSRFGKHLLVFCQSLTCVYNTTQQYTPQYSLKRHENRPTPRLVRDKSQQLLITRATNTGIDKRLWSVHTLECSTAIQRSKMTIRIKTWRNLRNMKLRERYQTHLKRQNLKVRWGKVPGWWGWFVLTVVEVTHLFAITEIYQMTYSKWVSLM